MGWAWRRERQRDDAERVESPRSGRGRTLANESRGKGTRESVLCVSRDWIDSSHAPGNGNSRAIHSRGQNEHPLNDAVRCTRGIASKQTPCVCTRDHHPAGSFLVLADPDHRTYCDVGLTLADYCDFRPRMPTGSASPTRWRDMALPRSRLASMRAAASAYGTIIWGIRDAKTGRNSGLGSARANAGT
jgi:hypothetical protein